MPRSKEIVDFLAEMKERYNPPLKMHAQMTAMLEGMDHPNIDDGHATRFFRSSEDMYRSRAEREGLMVKSDYYTDMMNKTWNGGEHNHYKERGLQAQSDICDNMLESQQRVVDEMTLLQEESSQKTSGTPEQAWEQFGRSIKRNEERANELLDEWDSKDLK